MTTQTCPVCGCPVKVVGKVTQHYEPILPESVERLIRAAVNNDDYLKSYLISLGFTPDEDTRRELREALAAVKEEKHG